MKKLDIKPGEQIAIAIDSAASSFALEKNGEYDLNRSHTGKMSSSQLIALAGDWIETYPIVLWEDPLAENDWEGFKQFTAKHGEGTLYYW